MITSGSIGVIVFSGCTWVKLAHNAGVIIAREDTQFLSISSAASSTTSDALYLLNGTILTSSYTFGTLSKIGICPFFIDWNRFSFDFAGSSLNGTNLNPKTSDNVEQVVNTDSNGNITSWYRKHSNGYIEQGGWKAVIRSCKECFYWNIRRRRKSKSSNFWRHWEFIISKTKTRNESFYTSNTGETIGFNRVRIYWTAQGY